MGVKYVEIEFLISKGLDHKTIWNGCLRFRNGKSKSWANKKDLKDKRKVLIDIDTIPEATRLKYNIPTGKEYLEQQQKEYEQRILNEREEQRLQALRDKEIRLDAEKTVLVNAYNKEYMQFVSIYTEKYANHKECLQFATLSAKQHAFWLKMLEVTGNDRATYSGGCQRGFTLFTDLKKELIFDRDFANENYFRILISKLRKTRLSTGCIADVVANGRKNQRNSKLNDFHTGLAMAFLSHPNKYSYRVVTDLINHHCEEEQQQQITESWLKKLMATNNQFRTVVTNTRNGAKYASDNLLANAVRKSTPFPADCWMIDGTPIQFVCWNENRTKQVRLNLFVIIDVCTRKIVGFDVSYSENKYEIMNALKRAVLTEGHLPAEIVSDNFSAAKSEEIIGLKAELERLGTYWRHARVGNPQDKTYVERFFGSFQSVECALYDDYLGEGITSKRDNRRNKEYIASMLSKNVLSYKEMVSRIIKMIAKYNERETHNKKSPLELYKSLPKANATEIDQLTNALLFWKRTKATVRRGMVKIVVQHTPYFFEVKKNKLKAELQGKEVTVRYDETDLSNIMLFDRKNDLAICECKRAIEFHTAKVNRTDEDDLNIHKTVAKKKSYMKYLSDTKDEIISKGLEVVNKEEIDLVHPLSLNKNTVNEKESLDFQEFYLGAFNIAKDEEEQPRTKPLETIYKKGKRIEYEDLIIEKKPQQKGSFEIASSNID